MSVFPTTLASVIVGPIEFQNPVWLLLAPALGVLVLLIARKSLAGLGAVTRWLAIGLRLVVLAGLSAALAEPHWRKEGKDVAVTLVLDVSQSVPGSLQRRVEEFVEQARRANPRAGDRLGLVTVGRSSLVQSLPRALNTELEVVSLKPTDATDLASGLRLAMAVSPPDAAARILIASDGNQTLGNLLDEAQRVKAAGVPVDVIPLTYAYESEVLVDRVVTPPNARMGEVVNVRAVLEATRPTRGRLNILLNGQAVDLDPDSPELGVPVELRAGSNVLQVPVKLPRAGTQQFEAVFDPIIENGRAVGDERAENNRQRAITFVTSEGKVLVVRSEAAEAQALVEALTESRIDCDVRDPEQAPATLAELSAYDAVILVNQPAYNFSQQQQQDLRQYVYDSGGGLIMIGGDESFGAGGWIGSPVEEVLPVRLDPPQKRQMPKGALAVVVHSVEFPEGVFYGKKVAETAVNALSRLDEAGIIEFDWQRGTRWVHPLAPVGDGTAIRRAIQNLTFGDMPDFAPSFELALAGLKRSDAGQKLMIVISDGDPTPPSNSLLSQFRDNKISVSSIAIGVHGISDQTTMQRIAERTGGRFYEVAQADVAKLPQIIFKEAQTVRRSLIWEGTPFVPATSAAGSESLRGIGLPVPAIGGYVVTADREGLSQVSMRGKENDPILAQWQHGLGRSLVFTSDASTRWAAGWVAWPQFRAFWEQQVRWAMRPVGSPNVRVATEQRGDQTVVTVDALDADGERLNFATFTGRVARPDGTGEDVQLRQVGPGRYQGVVRTDDAGSYVASLRYRAVAGGGEAGDRVIEGSVQAAINRPFADEFRALRDNAALLEQVRALTGGRVIGSDPESADLWSRQGLTMPVASTPLWLAVAIASLALFLADVGVRRVRVDPAAIARGVGRLFAPGKARAQAQTQTLHAARAKAQAQMDSRGAGSRVDDLPPPPPGPVWTPPTQSAGVKFEAGKDFKPTGDAVIAPGSAPPAPPAASKPGERSPAAEEGMSRLLKAKRRAQEEQDQ